MANGPYEKLFPLHLKPEGFIEPKPQPRAWMGIMTNQSHPLMLHFLWKTSRRWQLKLSKHVTLWPSLSWRCCSLQKWPTYFTKSGWLLSLWALSTYLQGVFQVFQVSRLCPLLSNEWKWRVGYNSMLKKKKPKKQKTKKTSSLYSAVRTFSPHIMNKWTNASKTLRSAALSKHALSGCGGGYLPNQNT